MTEAETILKLIETVAPDDYAALDFIDAHTFCYLKQLTFVGLWNHSGDVVINTKQDKSILIPSYTRSRDALKAIRPDGWLAEIQNYDTGSSCVMREPLRGNAESPYDYAIMVRSGKTEELAELHAIIQAIEYDRKHQGDTI